MLGLKIHLEFHKLKIRANSACKDAQEMRVLKLVENVREFDSMLEAGSADMSRVSIENVIATSIRNHVGELNKLN